MHGQHVVGERKLLAGSGIEGDQHNEPGPQHGQVQVGIAARQLADERLPDTATTSMKT